MANHNGRGTDGAAAASPKPVDHGILSRLSRRDIVGATSRGKADAGERSWRDGRVVALDVAESDDSVAIEARVQGSQRDPNEQTIEVWRTWEAR